MKKYIFLFVLLATSTYSNSQNNFDLSFNIGPNLSVLSGDGTFEDNEYVTNFIASISFGYQFSDRFSLNLGVGYEKKGDKYLLIIDPNIFNPNIQELTEITSELSFFSTNVLIRYSTNKKFFFFANTGPSLDFLIDSNYPIPLKKIDFGITSGLGVGLRMNNENKLLFEFRNEYGLLNLNNSRLNNNSINTIAFYLILGYSININ